MKKTLAKSQGARITKKAPSSRAKVSRNVSFSGRANRTAVEGPSSPPETWGKRETPTPPKASRTLPAPADNVDRPAEAKPGDTSRVDRKESEVLRLRLEKAPREKGTDCLASAQDDGALKAKRSTNTILSRLAKKIERRRTQNQPPEVNSFADFLLHHARVKSGSGYVPYHFAGREALRPIVERLDQILASGETDASLAICGGAQFGKTVLMLNLLAYLVGVRFRNVGYYLPDDDLVSGLVDGKLRPDVLDQIPWLARLIDVGKTLNASGRAVNRKGAFLCTDGTRTALAFMRGLGKIPTSFSMDVVVQDEKDDLPDEHARFLAGRMTASNLRLSLLIGTQRYHGAGQNLAFTEGTQHVGLLTCTGCGKRVNPETQWPGVCRLIVEGEPSSEWPRLTPEGNFSRVARATCCPGALEVISSAQEANSSFTDDAKSAQETLASCRSADAPRPGQQVARATQESELAGTIAFSPGQHYALCCPDCGALLDREDPQWHAQAPEREKLRRFSYRLSQLLIPAIDLEQIVAAWQLAIRDPEHMTVFCTDRLALPKSTTQTLTPGALEQARGDYVLEVRSVKEEGRSTEAVPPSYFSPLTSAFARYAGLDMGDQCWFVARAVDAKAPHNVRLLWIEPIAAERVRTRVPELFRELDLTALCVDAGPLRDLSRDLVFALNEGRSGKEEVRSADSDPCSPSSFFPPPSTLRWHEPAQRWRNVRAMAVEFTQREGQGLRHKYAQTQEGRAYPLLAANRDETIERVVQELLPPGVGDPRLLERPDGTAERIPTQRFLLPTATEATRNVLDLYERHLLAGARQERSPDGRILRYLDKCENHFLLATAYAALAELIAPPGGDPQPVIPMFRPLPIPHGRERSLIG